MKNETSGFIRMPDISNGGQFVYECELLRKYKEIVLVTYAFPEKNVFRLKEPCTTRQIIERVYERLIHDREAHK